MGAIIQQLTDFHHRLHAWYGQHGRAHLPWRNTSDPYHIWLSEVMLQQTQVVTVQSRFYPPFLAQFPTVQALAAADEQAVIKAWEGLGYYTRARNLHKAAKQVVAQYERDGVVHWPQDAESWQQLAGVGKNTAHAVCAFAFNAPYAVMEANLKRVIARVYALSDAHSTAGTKRLWACADELLDTAKPFDYNQAMMDVGATVCTPKNPNCDACPASVICSGKDEPEQYPTKPVKKTTPTRTKHIVVWQQGDAYAVAKRSTNFLNGLYGFAEYDVGTVDVTAMQALGAVRQVYSHFVLEADVFLADGKLEGGELKTLDEIEALPLSKADQKVLALLV